MHRRRWNAERCVPLFVQIAVFVCIHRMVQIAHHPYYWVTHACPLSTFLLQPEDMPNKHGIVLLDPVTGEKKVTNPHLPTYPLQT